MTVVEIESEKHVDTPREAPVALSDKVALAIGATLLCIFALRVFLFVQDDAFITYRYAWHLRHGYGPVFNPGEHTEGYSCFLFMIYAALLMLLPGDVLVRAKLTGLLFALGTLWAAWRLARELDLPPTVRAAVPVLLGANASFALYAIDGMETALQALLVTLAGLQFVREQRSGQGWASASLLLAVALNRAEGGIYFLAALVPAMLGIRRRGLVRCDLVWLAVFLIPMTLFLLWRHAYYGEWLPNTVTAKSMPLETVLDYTMGPAYVLRTIFVNLSGRVPALLISIALWLLVALAAAMPAMRRNGALFIPLAVFAQALVALRSGGDWMIGWRYMLAAVPLWTLLLAVGVQQLVAEITGKRAVQASRWMLTVCYIALMALLIGAGSEFAAEITRIAGPVAWSDAGWTFDGRKMVSNMKHLSMAITMADGLNAVLPSGASVAYSEMGVTPFYTPKLHWLDTYGLTDYEVAHLATATHTRIGIQLESYLVPSSEVGQLLLRRRPDYIIAEYPADVPSLPVLNGAYIYQQRIPIVHRSEHAENKPYALLVWRLRPELRGTGR